MPTHKEWWNFSKEGWRVCVCTRVCIACGVYVCLCGVWYVCMCVWYMFVCVCIIMLSAMIEVDKAPKIAWECDA